MASADAPLLARFADAQARAGQLEAARLTIKRGLEKDPDSPSLRAVERRLQTVQGR
jgi:ribosomal protein L16/L10AE